MQADMPASGGGTAPWPGIGAAALNRTAEDPGRVIVIDGALSLTRAELLNAARRLGGALLARGIGPGASIGFQLPNWWEACVINLAAALFGYRVVPLLTIYREAELGFILAAAGVTALFIPDRFRNLDYRALIARLPAGHRHVFVVRGDPAATDSFARLLDAEPAAPSPAAADAIKMILYTSGSTGRPKGVLHSHRSIGALIARTADFWQLGPDDVLHVPSPVGHIGGAIYAFEFPWACGCTAVLMDVWEPAAATTAVEQHGVTFMAGATPFLSGLVLAAAGTGSGLPSLRRFLCGGASVPAELVRQALAQFPNAVVSRGYGSTEVPLICPGIRDRAEAEVRADTDGECAADVRIVDVAGLPVTEGEIGEIVVRSPQMFLGYLDPADTEGAFDVDGFFRMGDLGRLVDRRFLELTGRTKDIIIRKGENISPMEIENALATHPAVREACVVGVPDPSSGETVVAFVLPNEELGFTFAQMTAHLAAAGLARQKFPEHLRLVAHLPRNSVGKVRKDELRAAAMNPKPRGAVS